MSSLRNSGVEIFGVMDLVSENMKPGEIRWMYGLQEADPSVDADRFQVLEVDHPVAPGVTIFGCEDAPFGVDAVLVCFDPGKLNVDELSVTTSQGVTSAYRVYLRNAQMAILVFLQEGWEYQFSVSGELVARVGTNT